MTAKSFPFTAIVGQKKLKQALLLNMINPAIGGILLSGEKGTAKSTLVRSLASLFPETGLLTLPLNITMDRLVGSLDLEETIKKGRAKLQPGLLQQADGKILYIDEVNLLDDEIINAILTVSSGEYSIARDGISASGNSEFILVGTMNPEEGYLRSQFLDRFGLYFTVTGVESIEQRKEIIKRRLFFEKDPAAFLKKYQKQEEQLRKKVLSARERLSQVKISEEIIKAIVKLVHEANCQGNRAEIVMLETVRALAALASRDYVNIADIKEAARLVLPHRRNQQDSRQSSRQESENQQQQQSGPEQKKENQQTESADQSQDKNHPGETEKSQQKEIGEAKEKSQQNPEKNSQHILQQSLQDSLQPEQDQGQREEEFPQKPVEQIALPDDIFPVRDIEIKPLADKKRKSAGSRSKTKSRGKKGRYVGYRQADFRQLDLAMAATLRTAALHQKQRRQVNNLSLVVKTADFKNKVREKRTGNTLLFAVDASGSMAARKRMEATKAAVLSLLNNAYQKRDRVGLLAFRQEKAEILLEITRSIDLASRRLKELPTGGRTPLAEGLLLSYRILKARMSRNPEVIPVLVLVSDFRPNVAPAGADPVQASKEIAQQIRQEKINTLIIDTEKDFIKIGLGRELAEIMAGQYFALNELKKEKVSWIVNNYLANNG